MPVQCCVAASDSTNPGPRVRADRSSPLHLKANCHHPTVSIQGCRRSTLSRADGGVEPRPSDDVLREQRLLKAVPCPCALPPSRRRSAFSTKLLAGAGAGRSYFLHGVAEGWTGCRCRITAPRPKGGHDCHEPRPHVPVAVLCFVFPEESRAAQLHDRVHGWLDHVHYP
jgi:hypothetical protein